METISSDHLIGKSVWVKETRKRIKQVAGYRSNVLIQGPSGTGKELVARALHTHSQRASSPFIPVNCSAIPSTLFSSQLFGHAKGAFTGAEHAALGCFRAAEGGTIFLDEIGEIDPAIQVKLLRFLGERTFERVGSNNTQTADVRLIAATNRIDAVDPALRRPGRFDCELAVPPPGAAARAGILALPAARRSPPRGRPV